uniref:Uncharacterized protein n=1 Tax=Meloidogyne incognita TaxID=6306 RepID=A0A914LE44_MELIC
MSEKTLKIFGFDQTQQEHEKGGNLAHRLLARGYVASPTGTAFKLNKMLKSKNK